MNFDLNTYVSTSLSSEIPLKKIRRSDTKKIKCHKTGKEFVDRIYYCHANVPSEEYYKNAVKPKATFTGDHGIFHK